MPTKWCVARYWFGPANSKAWDKLLVLRETAHPIVHWALKEELEERLLEKPSLLRGVVRGPSTGGTTRCACSIPHLDLIATLEFIMSCWRYCLSLARAVSEQVHGRKLWHLYPPGSPQSDGY